jgi:hypothetical protein
LFIQHIFFPEELGKKITMGTEQANNLMLKVKQAAWVSMAPVILSRQLAIHIL